MPDIRKIWTPDLLAIDAGIVNGDLDTTQELETAVINSLFTWRRARADDALPWPPGDTRDRQGWWGDTYPFVDGDEMGSRLWLLSREKLTNATLERALGYMREALAWLVEDRVAAAVDVTGEIQRPDRIAVRIIILRTTRATALDVQYDFVWAELLAA